MYHKFWFSLMVSIVVLLLITCAGQNPDDPNESPPDGEEPAPDPYAPAKGDEAMQRGEVFIDSQDILILESFPPQFRLLVKGSLPTPCHKLRAVVDPPDDQNHIQVQIYSLVDPNTVCTQVLEPFEVSISLGSYASGSYTVFVNGEEAGKISP